MADLRRMSQLMNVLTGIRGMREKEDPLERAQALANLESTALDIGKKRRELAGPSPTEKYQEEQRSQQVGSALAMFSDLYKTASPSSKKILGEQMGSLWGLMAPGDKTQFKMLVSHTPLNPAVQKGMWFEETNPRPQMPIVKEGDGSWTNNPPRNPEYRKLWAEFDIASDEWNTLRKMAVEGKKVEETGLKGVPKQYQTDDLNITAGRNQVTRGIEFTDWREVKANQAEIQVAIDKGWATWEDIKATRGVPISVPREYVENGRPVTVKQIRDIRDGGVKLQYSPAGPLDESKMAAPKELTDAMHIIDSNISPSDLKVKSPAVIGYYVQLKGIVKTSGAERFTRQLALQRTIVEQFPSEKRYIPFVPAETKEGWWFRFQRGLSLVPPFGYFVPTPSAGKPGNILLVQADRRVPFYDVNGVGKNLWWSDIYNQAYDFNGTPIAETQGKVPGATLDIRWDE